MILTKKQLWNVLYACKERPCVLLETWGAYYTIYARVSTPVKLPYKIGADTFCKSDEDGHYRHRKFALASVRIPYPFSESYVPGKAKEKADRLWAKYDRWIEEIWSKVHSTSATYVRGEESVELQATIGRTIFEQRDECGVLEKAESHDFLVRAEDLVIDGSVTLPERGDLVRETQEGHVYVYEVMAPGKEPHYRFSDPYLNTLRIHTKAALRAAEADNKDGRD